MASSFLISIPMLDRRDYTDISRLNHYYSAWLIVVELTLVIHASAGTEAIFPRSVYKIEAYGYAHRLYEHHVVL